MAQGFVCVKSILSPVKSRHGTYHTEDVYQEAGCTLDTYIPEMYTVAQTYISVNAQHIEHDNYTTTVIEEHDEIVIRVLWGLWAGVVAALIQAAVALVVSLVIQAIFYFAFPTKTPKLKSPRDDISFAWEGITTTQGPGNVIPVSYGHNKLGGQLLHGYYTTRKTKGGNNNRPLFNPQPVLHMLLAACEGEISTIETTTININGQPISNYQDVEVETSNGPASNPIRFGDVKNTYSAGDVNLTLGNTVYTTVDEVDEVILEVDFLEGLFTINTNGSSGTNTSRYQYRYKPFGTGSGSYTAFVKLELTAEVYAVAHSPTRIQFATKDRYDIQVGFLSANETDSTRSKYAPYLHAVTEIIDTTQSYPNTAVLSFEITAMSNLQGALPNVQFYVDGLKVRQGSFGASKTYSDNPAWCLMDFMTNTRYGGAIADSDISLPSFIAFAAYCNELVGIDTTGDGVQDATEKRCILNYTLDTDKEPLDAFQDMLSGTRGVLVKTEGLWKVKIARDDTPVQLVTWASTIRDSVILRYVRDIDAMNVIEARFLNDAENYENDLVTYPTFEDWPNTVRKLSIQYRGVTRATQVLRECVFELNARRLPRLTLEFTIALEGIIFEVMDIINFAYPKLTQGISGRVGEAYGTAVNTARIIILDEDFTFGVGITYIVYIQLENDTLTTRILSSTLGGTTTRVALLDAGEADLPSVPVALSSKYTLGNVTQTNVIPFRITDIQRSEEHAIKVQCIQHVPEIYAPYIAYDATASLGTGPALFTSGSRPPPLTSLTGTPVFVYKEFESQNMAVVLEWDVANIDSNATESFAPYGGVEIYISPIDTLAMFGETNFGEVEFGGLDIPSDNPSSRLLTTIRDTNIFTFRDHFTTKSQQYLYTVVPISTFGVPNQEGALALTMGNTPGTFVPPDNLMFGDPSTTNLVITWVDNTDPRLSRTQIYRGLLSNHTDSVLVDVVPVGTQLHESTGLAPGTMYYFRIRNVQLNGSAGSYAFMNMATL